MTGGATLRSMRGSTCTAGGLGRGVAFNSSSAPGGSRMVIWRRASSSSSRVGACGGKILGSRIISAMNST